MLQDVSTGLEKQNKMTKSIPSSRERWWNPVNKLTSMWQLSHALVFTPVLCRSGLRGGREVRLSSRCPFDLLLTCFWWLQRHWNTFWVRDQKGICNIKDVFTKVIHGFRFKLHLIRNALYARHMYCIKNCLLVWFEWAYGQFTPLALLHSSHFIKTFWNKNMKSFWNKTVLARKLKSHLRESLIVNRKGMKKRWVFKNESNYNVLFT